MIDGLSDDPLADYSQINTELALFDEYLAQKPQIVVFNKIDLPEAQERWLTVEESLRKRGIEPIAISAATQKNVRQLVQLIFQTIGSLPEPTVPEPARMPVYELPEEEIPFTVIQEGEGVYRVSGKRIERAALMTHWEYEDAVLRFQRILETLGVSEALEAAGVEPGDTVFIGDFELEWSE
ncbi:MAG: Obg family GTPase CgtA [Anaerolineae bacterium]|nr:Obg family GTPase CgtA [Anaerolineae bacterium]